MHLNHERSPMTPEKLHMMKEQLKLPLVQEQDPLDIQVGGGHYKDLKIQPIEYIYANDLSYCEANIVKYITRWKQKNGIEDLNKVKHYVDLLIKLEGL